MAGGKVVFRGDELQRLRSRSSGAAWPSPEGRRVFPKLTVADNLRLGAVPQRDRAAVEAARERVFDLFPILRERNGQSAGTLSGGQQQMLAIARSLMAGPQLLLLDEPSLGLAPILVDQIFELIVRLRERARPFCSSSRTCTGRSRSPIAPMACQRPGRAGRPGAAPAPRPRSRRPGDRRLVTLLADAGQEAVQQIINALSLGSTYALLALGLAMVFSILGLINASPTANS